MTERIGRWRRRLAAAFAGGWLAVAGAAGAAGASEFEVAIPTGSGLLAGTMLLPDGDARVPAMLLLAGSGPTDRDGNQPGLRTGMLRLLAEGLRARGIATLRVDKRGIGGSAAAGPDEAALRISRYVDDARLWLAFLGRQPRVGRVIAAGHSEGGLVAMLAVPGTPAAGLVLLATPGEPAGAVVGRQLDAAGLPPALLDRADLIIGSIERGEVVRAVPEPLMPLFRPSVQPFLASLFAIDPAEALARTKVPVLVVQGTHDMQLETADADRLAGARPGVSLVVLDGVNHVLRRAPRDRAANLASYDAPAEPLAPGVVEAVARFVEPRAR